jgi:predicted permease
MSFFNRLRGLWKRDELDSHIDEELQSHLAMRADDNVRAGMSADQARYDAQKRLGNSTLLKENTRQVDLIRWLETAAQDLRYAGRMLRKSPVFTAIAVLTLAIGIGANSTIFSWIDATLLNPLPGAGDPQNVVALESLAPSGEWVPTSYLDFRDFRDNTKLIESMSVAQPIALAVGNNIYVERAWGELVSGNFFDLLQVRPEIGRFFDGAERDEAQNAHPVAVISDSFWKSRFHSDRSAIGTTLRVNQQSFTIIGVAPGTFHGSMPGLSFDMWIPATMQGELTSTGTWMLRDRKTRMFRVLARLAPGVRIEQARADIASLAGRMAKADADTNEGMSATLLPMWKSHYGIQDSLRAPLGLLMGASGLVLLIVCANVANLLLARATSRRKEFSIRLALGATRARLARQLLTEVWLLAILGSLVAVWLASLLSGSLRVLLPASVVPQLLQPSINGGVLWFSAGLAFLTAALAGLAPVLNAVGKDVNEGLQEDGRGGTAGAQSRRLRGLLVTSEVALAVIAIIGAGLFLKSFFIAKALQPGFDPSHVALAGLNLSAAGFDAKQADAFCLRLRSQLEAQPGVTAVTYSDYVPLSVSAGSWEDLEVQGYVPGPSENMKIYRNLVAPGYFSLMKIPLLAGRDFNMLDDTNHPPVMVVSREFVRRFIAHHEPIGTKVNGWGMWFSIIGVVDDIKVNRLTEKPQPYFYVPIRQIYRPEMGLAFYVRTSGSTNAGIAALRSQAQTVDAAVPVFDTVALSDYIAGSLFGQRVTAILLTALAAVSFLLAAIGLYGVMAYSVAQRTREIGIRMALGAHSRDVLRMIASQCLRFALIGIAAGSLGAIFLARAVSAMLVTVSPLDPSIYVAAAAFTILIALAAGAIPARRAMRVDPMVALRYE